MAKVFSVLLLALVVGSAAQSRADEVEGILVLAHGSVMGHMVGQDLPRDKSQCEIIKGHGSSHGDHRWEDAICSVIDELNKIKKATIPVEIGFGMTDVESFQHGVDRLANAGMNKLRVIPLYVSSHSDVIREQKEIFGLMASHSSLHGKVIIPKAVTKVIYDDALDQAVELSQALITRAKELSRNPVFEELILVGHGPNTADDDALWVRDFLVHGDRIQENFSAGPGKFYNVHAITVQDDAPEDVRQAKTMQLRSLITEAIKRGNKAIILPVLIAPGSIESGIAQRLRGLDHVFGRHMLAPDPNITQWVNNKIQRN